MKNFVLSTMFLLLCAGFALAQSTSSSNPSSSGTSTQSTPDQTSQPSSTQSQPGTAGQSSTSQSGTSSMGTQTASDNKNKGNKEKSVTGCLESAGSSGQYMVRHKNKDITVVPSSSVSSEIANHVGHKVKLYGTWEQASARTPSGDNTMASNLPQSDQPGAGKGTAGGTKTDMGKNAKEFRADRIEMVSDTCGGSKSKDTTGSTPKPY